MYYTRKTLEKICMYCTETDYLEHHFFMCKNVKQFWLAIENWWKNTIEVTFKLDACNVLFGIPRINEDPIIDVMNFCILYAKYYIYQQNLSNGEMFFLDYVKLIKDKLEIEKTVCMLNHECNFDKKWAFFYDLI